MLFSSFAQQFCNFFNLTLNVTAINLIFLCVKRINSRLSKGMYTCITRLMDDSRTAKQPIKEEPRT